MGTDFIDQLRNASFPVERRGGYSREAVESYLSQLADWLETGGDDQARAALVQREMERVGERTGTILSAAQESADRITAEAGAEAARVREEAERETAEQRADADAYASETRARADQDARTATEAAAREATETRAEAEEHARLTIRDADARLARAEQRAAEMKRQAEADLADLARKRQEVLTNVEELATGLRGVVEGPGSADLGLPEGIEDGDVTVRRAEPAEADAGEHRAVASAGSRRAEPSGTSYRPPTDEPTAPTEPVAEEDDDYDYETDEQELRRRRSAIDSAESPTEETKLTELL